MEEIWRDIKGYESFYEVSNLGRVRRSPNANRLHTDGVLRGTIRRGYKAVTISKDKVRKTFNIHRLVAEAFIPNPDNLPFVNHKDENKLNNVSTNLEWCSAEYNVNYGSCILRRSSTKVRNGKTCIPIRIINTTTNLSMDFRNITECAAYLGTSRIQIRRCIRNNKLFNNIYKLMEL